MSAREKQFDDLKKKVFRSVRPILRDDLLARRSDPDGSCVLLKIGVRRFLLSAAHIFRDRKDQLRVVNGRGSLVPLNNVQVFLTTHPDRRDPDNIDVAYVELLEEKRRFFEDDEFLSMDDVDGDEVASRSSVYTAFGYPVASAVRRDDNTSVRFSATTFRTIANMDAYKSRKPSVSINTHIVVKFDRSKMVKAGTRSMAPKPLGMSGGALLRLGDAKLIGILTEWDQRHKVMIAAHVGFCLESIRTNFPDLTDLIPPPRFLKVRVRTTAV